MEKKDVIGIGIFDLFSWDLTGFSGDGTVHESDLRAFYEHFVGVSSDEIDKVTANGYAQMTANGDYKLCR